MHMVGVDVGGTFTDVILADPEGGAHRVHKVPTTVDDPSAGVCRAVLEVCAAAEVAPSDLDYVFHGTTIATNTMLEHRGAQVGVITTEGFRDVLHIARHQRPQNYSIMQEVPWQDRPLARRRHRLTVSERLVPPHGEVLRQLDEDAVREAARTLRDAGCDAVAICFLFAYLNPVHERRAKEIVADEHPEAFITASSDVFPQFREFERFTTAAINAFVGPPVRRYMHRLSAGLAEAGVRGEVHIMRSNGGVAPAGQAAEEPVTLLLSGPAAGVLGGRVAGEASGAGDLITFDVGGTSADIGTVVAGGTTEASARDTWIAGFPVMVPMLDISTIGAGGGSIAYVDEGGAFRVGPRSAGARPGPAAYGFGGTEATVTDAHVVLGRLQADRFLGGGMALDADAATAAVRAVGDRLGLSLHDAATGILRIIDSAMANAIRALTVQRGLDPRAMTLVAFGGAGPLHAVEVARMLGVRDVLIPPYPGICAAIGLLVTDIRYDRLATQFMLQGQEDLTALGEDLDRLEREIRAQLEADGLAPGDMRIERSLDCRYVGQGYELSVPLPAGTVGPAEIAAAWAAMHERHRVEYGHAFEDNTIEIVNARVTGVGATPRLGRLPVQGPRSLEAALVGHEAVHFREQDGVGASRTAFYDRAALPVGDWIEGPAVILQPDTTTLLVPGSSARLDEAGNLRVTPPEAPS
jgi:N-methylhydantoinase A/oxoprolinase/acetone carboxylase beta subunit